VADKHVGTWNTWQQVLKRQVQVRVQVQVPRPQVPNTTSLYLSILTLVGVCPSSSRSSSEAGGHRGGPGVGVRLNSYQPRGRSTLSQINDRERLKLDKFTSLLSASNVNLGLSAFHSLFCPSYVEVKNCGCYCV